MIDSVAEEHHYADSEPWEEHETEQEDSESFSDLQQYVAPAHSAMIETGDIQSNIEHSRTSSLL